MSNRVEDHSLAKDHWGIQRAEKAARWLEANFRTAIHTHGKPRICLILGTGWDKALAESWPRRAMPDVPGFSQLGRLAGHERNVIIGLFNNVPVIALSGRVHLNEGHGPEIPQMVRLQAEMLVRFGVTHFVLTNAAGALVDDRGEGPTVGSLVIHNDFLTLHAPPLPLTAGEFCSPHAALDPALQTLGMAAAEHADLKARKGVFAMVRGPYFEGPTDKRVLHLNGADAVGMSILPEAAVLALYPLVKALAVSFITNGPSEPHDHTTNLARARASSERLGIFIAEVVRGIAHQSLDAGKISST